MADEDPTVELDELRRRGLRELTKPYSGMVVADALAAMPEDVRKRVYELWRLAGHDRPPTSRFW